MDHQSVSFSCTSSSPATKTDQNSPYTLHQRTYTIGEQIHSQTALNRSNIHWLTEKKWRCRNKKILLLFITKNTIRHLGNLLGTPAKMLGAPSNSQTWIMPLSWATTIILGQPHYTIRCWYAQISSPDIMFVKINTWCERHATYVGTNN